MEVSTVTVLGNVVAEPRITNGDDGISRASFRVVANQRRLDRETNTWIDAGEYGVTVVCWRSLARGVAGSVHSGDPVLVVGRITERQYEVDGVTKYTTEVTASFVGHDLARGHSSFKRFSRAAATPVGSEIAVASTEGGNDGGDTTGNSGVGDEVPVPFETDEQRSLAAV